MIHRWEAISYKIKFNFNNELKNELEEPKLEKNPKIYSQMIKEEKNKKVKKQKKTIKYEKNNDSNLITDKDFNEPSFEPIINQESIIKEEINKANNLNDLIEYENEKINENVLENDEIINLIDKNDSTKNIRNNNISKELVKSKSVDKLKNISFKVEKQKNWQYSYYRKDNTNEDNIFKTKNKKKLMNNVERQQLFNDLYNDCQKRKEKYQKLKIEKEAQFNTLYTFTPKIFQNKLNEKYMKNMIDSKFYLKTNTNLNNSEINKINNTISTSNIGIIQKDKWEENKTETPINFISRLSEYEKIKKQNLEKIKNEIYIDYERNKISKRNKKSYDKILNNHLLNNSENYIEIKQKNIEKIKQELYKEQGITFQPKTNKNFNNKIKNDIIERNNEFMKEKQEKMEKYSHIKEKECTFKPKINNLRLFNNKENDKQSNVSYKTDQNSSDVSKRLFDYQKKYKENLEDIRSKYKENYTFNPIISKNTKNILNNRQKLKEKIGENINIENQNYELLKKQIQLGELEELSKKLEEIKNDNLEIEKSDLNKDKTMNNKERKFHKTKIKKNDLNYKDNFNDKHEENNQIMDLANDLVNNNKISNKNENTNDFILLMNNSKNKNIPIQKTYNFDFDNSKGNKQIMNLNYYDNLF